MGAISDAFAWNDVCHANDDWHDDDRHVGCETAHRLSTCETLRWFVSYEIVWKDVKEEDAYRRLTELVPVLTAFKLHDSEEALRLLLEGRRKRGRWNWGVLQHFVNRFESEFGAQDATYADGIVVLKHVLKGTFNKKRTKSKLIDIFEVQLSVEDRAHLETTLGVAAERTEAALKRGDVKTAVLLAGLCHVIRYEIRGGFARRRIHAWSSPSIRDPDAREKLVERFLTLKRVGDDGKPDTFHLRNAFAHAHFDFQTETSIRVWDQEEYGGSRTFEGTLTVGDLLGLSTIFEKKLKLVEIHPSLIAAIDELNRVYKHEWKSYRGP